MAELQTQQGAAQEREKDITTEIRAERKIWAGEQRKTESDNIKEHERDGLNRRDREQWELANGDTGNHLFPWSPSLICGRNSSPHWM